MPWALVSEKVSFFLSILNLRYMCYLDLLERFSQLQVMPYEKLFGPDSQFFSLDSIDKRFRWFRRLQAAMDTKGISALFPPNYALTFHLYAEFSRRTKKHLIDILGALERSKPDPVTHVQTLLKSLKFISAFETEIKTACNDFDAATEEDKVKIDYSTSMSEAFDTFLGPYVQLEREELDKLMTKLMNDEEKGERLLLLLFDTIC